MKKKELTNKLSIGLCAFLLATASGHAEENNVVELEEVGIEGAITSNYLSTDKSSTLKNNMSLDETPKSIQIYNEELIQDSQAQKLNDIVVLSSNTTYLGDNNGKEHKFAIRGFSGVPVLRDGFSLSNAIIDPELFNLEKVEVIKGPDSLMYGQSSPGGLINIVKKTAKKESLNTIELELMSNNAYSPKFDISGKVNNNNSLRYRIVGVYRHDDGYKNFNTDNERFFIAPSLSYDIDDNNTLTFISEYLKETTFVDFGAYLKSNGELAAPIETVYSHPDEKNDKLQKVVGFDFDSTFDTWNSTLRYRYSNIKNDFNGVYSLHSYIEATDTVRRMFSSQKYDFSEHSLAYTLNKEIDIFNFKNRITTGLDFAKSYNEFEGYMASSPLYSIDILNPIYETLYSVSNYPGTLVSYGNTGKKIGTKKFGAFLQDNIDITDNWILSAGLRYTESKPDTSQKTDAVTPSVGLVYKISPKTSIYTSYSESFTPQTKTDVNGKLLDPETGNGMELGVKQKLFNDKFNLTAAIFQIEKENVAMTDPNYPLSSIASGKQASEGYEFDLVGEITKGWSLIASYGYTKTEDKSTNQGKELAGIPKHTANLFTTYNLAEVGFPYIYVGGGARYLGTRYANTTNTIKLDSTVIYNAILGYKKGHWDASVSVQNITDEIYVETASNVRVYTGTPRTVIAALRYKF
ncbi:MAG: TonB-dependent siderophore receptor [Arcobacteraceae bacterium]|nr:TonB-dependent siderophore receptor [Arcobacteraceae bacterium]